VSTEVVRLITDRPRLAAMTDAAGRVGHRDAARRVAEVVLDVARDGQEARR
jgi:UDP-N-acetylglucosamine--N-acetylmuramyl-(pentapeptide) pyrophosphoryl-undecaprenol N-acetylglucosamine transferase